MRYFAFGMNMAPYTMENATPIGAATLPGWQLDFRYFADVQPVSGAVTHGVLWEIDEGTERMLDGREGVPHLYGKHTVQAIREASPEDALVYAMSEKSLARGIAQPSASYLNMLYDGYREFGIDPAWLQPALDRCGYKPYVYMRDRLEGVRA